MTASIAPRCAARRNFIAAGIALASTFDLACSGKEETPSRADVDGYMQTLPTWAEYSPLRLDSGPTRTQAATWENVTGADGKSYACTTTPYAMERTPRDLVMFSPDVEILWPGSLIQGRSYISNVSWWGWNQSPWLTDVSGDGLADLVLLEPQAGPAQEQPRIVVAPAQREFLNQRWTFTGFGTPVNHSMPALPGGETDWRGYTLFIGKVNSDMANDIVMVDPNAVSHVFTMIR